MVESEDRIESILRTANRLESSLGQLRGTSSLDREYDSLAELWEVELIADNFESWYSTANNYWQVCELFALLMIDRTK